MRRSSSQLASGLEPLTESTEMGGLESDLAQKQPHPAPPLIELEHEDIGSSRSAGH